MHKSNWNPIFDDLKPIASAFDDLLNEGISSILGAGLVNLSPRVNIIENDTSYQLELAAPGLQKEDFSIEMKEEKLFISFEAKNHSDKKYIRQEYRRESFSKSFHLPKDADKSQISARYENGVLVVTIAKLSQDDTVSSRTITID